MKKYQVGVIGAGWMARAHMKNLQKTERASIRWIAARNPENLERVRAEFGVPFKTHDYTDMLKDTEVEVVIITTPPYLHKEMFIETVRAGKHVLLEKPMALDMQEIDVMMSVKEQHPEIIAMECSGRHSRLTPKFRTVRDLIASGKLGEVYAIYHSSVARQNRPGIEFHPPAKWFLDRSLAGGGPLFDWGVYDLSFHLGVLGDRFEVEEVESAVLKGGLDTVGPGTDVYDVEEHLMVQMRLSKQLRYSWERAAHANMDSPNETRIYGTRGGIKLGYCTWDDPWVIFYDLDERGKAREEKIELDYEGLEDGEALTEHLIGVLDGTEEPVVTLETAKKHMDILCKCREVADNSL
jgi:predicted dehydrogenase